MKKTVGGKNELFDLCEQWMSAVKYWRHSIVVYLEGCTVEEEIGVFTVNFEPARIEAEIERLTFKIRKLDGKERHYLRVEC